MDLAIYALRSISSIVVKPTLALIVVILGLMFYMKNRKISAMQKIIIGERINSPLELTLSQICLGIIAGAVGSVILSELGVIFNNKSGIQLLFIISLLLMFIKPRFICFSYSGAILGVISIIVTYLNIGGESDFLRIDIVTLMTLVGVLHIVESFLVMFDGNRGSIPVFTKKNGSILGGYALSRFWPIPIALFLIMNNTNAGAITQTIETPTWWPLISNANILNSLVSSVLVVVPFFGMLSYSSVTFTRTKKEKAISSAVGILIYGILLTLLAQLAKFGLAGQIIVLIFAPLGHEFMIRRQRRSEDLKDPLFVSEKGRICVLDVLPYSSSYEAGIIAGDRILAVNGKEITSEREIYTLTRGSYGYITLNVEKKDGSIVDIEIKKEEKKRVGLLLVPIFVEEKEKINVGESEFKEILNKIKQKEDEINNKNKDHKE